MKLNRNMTNDQLVEAAAKALDSGEVLIVDKVETSNPDFVNVYVAQNIEDLPLQSTAKVSEFEAQALGWDRTAILMRARFNAQKDFADKLEIGTSLKDIRIRVLDTLESDWEDQNPRMSKDGEVRQKDGNDIFRHTKVMTNDEFEKIGGHSTIKFDVEPKAKEEPAPASVSEKDLTS